MGSCLPCYIHGPRGAARTHSTLTHTIEKEKPPRTSLFQNSQYERLPCIFFFLKRWLSVQSVKVWYLGGSLGRTRLFCVRNFWIAYKEARSPGFFCLVWRRWFATGLPSPFPSFFFSFSSLRNYLILLAASDLGTFLLPSPPVLPQSKSCTKRELLKFRIFLMESGLPFAAASCTASWVQLPK